MIYFFHDGKKAIRLTHESGKELDLPHGKSIVDVFIYVAAQFPSESILWIKGLKIKQKQKKQLLDSYKGQNYMVSLGCIDNHFLYPEIGYVTDGPFMAVSSKVVYPTWLMQDAAGIIAAAVVNQFKSHDYKNTSFEYLLTSIARIGQPQGLFCYHIPENDSVKKDLSSNNPLLFRFVAQHYKRSWSFMLLFLMFRYENEFSFLAFAKAQLKPTIHDKKNIKLTAKIKKHPATLLPAYEVIIPTIGRREYLFDVLKDFAHQSHLPSKIIIVEQNPDQNSVSELHFLEQESWPFEINHIFTHQTGACNARNRALNNTNEQWVMLFDDDNRFNSNVFENIFYHIQKLGIQVLNTAYLQENEVEQYFNYTQWSTFGSGCSMVHREVLNNCKFDMALEHGYGEDTDFGMQIRNAGFDIIYVPMVSILHLKAPVGGFRKKIVFPWSNDSLQPKPSPQVMYQREKNNTIQQLRGYKLTLFLKFYKNQSIRNPFRYYSNFNKRWKLSKDWSRRLSTQSLK